MGTTRIACMLLVGILCGLPSGGEAETLTIPGTGACEAVLKSVAAEYGRMNPLARVVIPPSVHSEGGIRQVSSGDAVIARVSRPLTREEAGKKLVYRVFARDAVVFVVGAGVRARGLTIRQITDIFSGKVAQWEDLAAGKGPIRVLVREQGDACLNALVSRYPEIRSLRFTSQSKVLYHDSEMVDMLQKYRNSVGFTTMSSLGAASATVTPVAIDGVAPTKENVSAGKYPVLIEYAIVYREGALPREAVGFIDFLFSRAGRDALSSHGVSPPER
ncbi:MAG: substrate-binding domain-containing protein [bacterium]|nr:substrate-binding domain-containing protein [bacterium]